MSVKHLIIVVGPTAVGKTSLSIELAKELKTEILSADSRQFFKETEIGTAKPTPEELSQARHHFINSLSIHDDYNAGMYEKQALILMDKLFQQYDYLVMVGGSGLYVKAVCDGIDEMPDMTPGLREELNSRFEEEGLEPLKLELKKLDPEYFEEVDQQNPQRIIRALEVIRSSGHKYSDLRKMKGEKKERPFRVIKIGLEMPRDILYQRIDERMDIMIAQGLFEEARYLFEKRHLNALQTVGYTEIFDYLEGKYDEEEAVRLLKRNSRRYAKRQLTWFKKDEAIRWFSPDSFKNILEYVNTELSI